MHKRFLAISVVGVTLLFGQVGNFLIAALCPHLRTGIPYCATHVAQPMALHHDMGDMQMDSEETEPSPPASTESISSDNPSGPCSHCAVHSRTTSNVMSLKETEVVKGSADLTVPVRVEGVVSVNTSPSAVWASRAHGPPGNATTRYILINIFRI